MTDSVFATLDEVNPRDAWAHEALRFTPWLVANLDLLSQAIGIPLELERAEAPVGRYAADILDRMADWLHTETGRYVATLTDVLGEGR